MADAVGVGFRRDAVIVSRHRDIGGCEPRENAGQCGKTRKTARIVQAMAHVERHKRGIYARWIKRWLGLIGLFQLFLARFDLKPVTFGLFEFAPRGREPVANL